MDQTALNLRDEKIISKYYTQVPREQVERLFAFRREHPAQTVQIDGRTWEYLSAGEGPQAVLLLPGALGTAESAWQTMQGLAETFRVISPTYAAVPNMNELADGIARVLDHAGVEQVHVVGGSYGGFVAQVFVRRHPRRTASLVISHAGPPEPERARRIHSVIRLLSILPMGMVRKMFTRSMSRLFPQGHPETAFLQAYFKEVVETRLRKDTLVSGYRRTIDFDNNMVYSPDDLAGWPGRVLLLLGDDDPGTPEEVREKMRSLYPRARVHIFSGTGHSAAILKRDEYLGLIRDFILEE
jgi:pimeloyl-ACP methyl ester carboxylesterase